jgi:hypothetical protein
MVAQVEAPARTAILGGAFAPLCQHQPAAPPARAAFRSAT